MEGGREGTRDGETKSKTGKRGRRKINLLLNLKLYIYTNTPDI